MKKRAKDPLVQVIGFPITGWFGLYKSFRLFGLGKSGQLYTYTLWDCESGDGKKKWKSWHWLPLRAPDKFTADGFGVYEKGTK